MEKFKTVIFPEILFILGALAFGYGVYMISSIMAALYAGGLLMLIAVGMARKG